VTGFCSNEVAAKRRRAMRNLRAPSAAQAAGGVFCRLLDRVPSERSEESWSFNIGIQKSGIRNQQAGIRRQSDA
jgi:hypothetical protein